MSKRYTYACTIIDPELRDVAHKHQEDPEEANPLAEVGEVRQVHVNLSDEAVKDYKDASNFLEIEEVSEAHTLGWLEETVDTSSELMNAAGVTLIPTEEDTNYGRSTFLRTFKNNKQGEGVVLGVIDTGLGATVSGWLRTQIKASRSTVGLNPLAATNDHGTHVLCTALPDKAKVVVGQGLGANGSGTTDGLISLCYWMVDEQNTDVINLSVGGTGGELAWERFLSYAKAKGVLVLCAGGNEAQRGNPRTFPGGCKSAIAVAAYDRNTDSKASFSNHHDYVDLAHSGVNVLSYLANGKMGRMSGTSMATPNTTWTAVSLLAVYPKGKVRDMMYEAARKTGAPQTHEGNGVVRGRKAQRKLAQK